MEQTTGIFKVTLDSLTLLNHKEFKEKKLLQLQLGEFKAVVKVTGCDIGLHHQVHIYKYTGKETLKIRVSNKETSHDSAFCEFKLDQFAKIPDVTHHLKANLYHQHKNEVNNEKEGTLVMELKFSKDLKWSMLDIRVNKAVLRRDTEVIGKMDPFVEIKLGEQTKRTTVKDEAGMYPVWGELYTIPVINPLIAIKFTVFDEDVTTNDLVGAAEIDMDERGMLSGFQWKDHVFELTYHGKNAGDLFISTRFTSV